MLEKFFDSVVDHNAVPLARVYNKYCLTPLVIAINESLSRQWPELIVTVPFNKQFKSKKEQNKAIVTQLKACAINLSFDLLTDDFPLWSKHLAAALKEFSNAKVKITKVAVLGKNISRFESILKEALSVFEFIEMQESDMFENDIFIIPIDMKIGTLIKVDRNALASGIMIYEDLVKKISYHSDEQLFNWVTQSQVKPVEPTEKL